MKKILSILVLSIAAAGCINEIRVDFGEVTPQLVLNAQMEAKEGIQLVYLSESTLSSVKPLKDATVTVYVDGKPFASAFEAVDDEFQDNALATAYSFRGGFPAGSQVKVTAKKGSWEAWAQADVLPAPAISAVDTLRSMERDMDITYESFQTKITFRDLPGGNYYRAGVRAECQVTQVNAAGETREMPVVYDLPMSGSQDPVLGGVTAGMSLFSLDKTYLVFSDEMFSDQGEYSLRLTIPSEQLYPFYYFSDWRFIPLYAYFSVTLIPWVESVSREEFDYLNALNNLENFGYTAEVIVEPTTLPSNVNGGLGFFAVRSRTEWAPLQLPVARMDYYQGPNEEEEDAGQ